MADNTPETITLLWHRFDKLTKARKQFRVDPCVYLLTDPKGTALRVGMAGKGLEPRYRGGTAYALDAAMHGSGNQVYVASLMAAFVQTVENMLIFSLQPPYNNQGKINLQESHVLLNHIGEIPECLRNHSHNFIEQIDAKQK